MATSSPTFNNCFTCKNVVMNGIFRNSRIYCSENCYSYRPGLVPTYLPKEKSCNYCFNAFDVNIKPGISYGNMWFCCQEHLDLANPRTKIVVGGPFMHHVPLMHHGLPMHHGQMIMITPQMAVHPMYQMHPFARGFVAF